MFIVTLTYQKPLDEIDRLMPDHVAFLEESFQSGTFITAGRQLPRTGGIILARGLERDALEVLMNRDPFISSGAATFTITEFRTSLHHPNFAKFADPRTRAVKPV